MEQLIINALKSACGNKNIKFQIIIQDNLLHIYANHRQDYHPQYAILEENVGEAIAALGLETIDSVWLYGRPLGQTEPNWQVFVELPTQGTDKRLEDTAGKEFLDPLDNLPDLESLISTVEGQNSEPGIEDSREDTESFSQDLWHQEIEPDEDSIAELDFTDFVGFSDATTNSAGDTGLLQNTGFVHGSPLKEAEINTLSPDFNLSEVSDPTPEVNPLAQYCFITNQKLLTEQTTEPKRDIMRMVKFFHHLSEADRQQLLPILDTYFREGVTPGVETTLPAIENWVQKIKELNEEDRHLLAVWLSRYCFNPEATLEEFNRVSAANVAETNNKNSKKESSSTEYSFVTVNQNLGFDPTKDDIEIDRPKFQLPPGVKKLLLPGIWILATTISIVLSIFSHSSNVIVASAQIPALCRNTISSPEYCRLAVNLAGEKAIAKAPTSLFPLTEVTETVADYGCGRYANLKAGVEISKIPPATTPVISTHGEKVFPHIYVIEVEQKHAQQPGNIKVGCVYTVGQGQRSPKQLATNVIPLNWPEEHYQQQAGEGKRVSFGIYAKPIKLGLYTIFAALGIAIASRLNLGLKINRAHTIYLVALLLGVVQLSMSLLPAFSLLGAIIVPIAIIPFLSLLLKDFQLNWKRGYPSIAISVLTIVAIQFLLYGLFLGLISGLV